MICGSGGSKSRPAGHRSDEKLHAVVARSTFPSQKVQNTRGSDHFWKLRCRKSARRCGAKHMSKSKCTKHTVLGPLLEVEMSKKCTPLWREAHFESLRTVSSNRNAAILCVSQLCCLESLRTASSNRNAPFLGVSQLCCSESLRTVSSAILCVWQLCCLESPRTVSSNRNAPFLGVSQLCCLESLRTVSSNRNAAILCVSQLCCLESL